MTQLRIGVIGSGMIAAVVADAIKRSDAAIIAGVASRRLESAQSFASEHGIDIVFDDVPAMLASADVDAVYIATPTHVKEDIALAAAAAKKHLLVDKPFDSTTSVQKMATAAQDHGVAFMDATHFTNSPRTKDLREGGIEREIGAAQVVKTSFFFPFMDRSNIRFNPEKEPTGAVGDTAWYSMRAIVEFLQPHTPVKSVGGSIVRDAETGAIIRGSGHIAFEDGKSSTFDFGYNAGVCILDLDILGHDGMIHMDDYALDWKDGFCFDDPDHKVGYTKRTGMQTSKEWAYHVVETEKPQTVWMIDHFAALAKDPAGEAALQSIARAVQTQDLLDQYWNAVKEGE